MAGQVETPIFGEMSREAVVAITGKTSLIARLIQPEEVRQYRNATYYYIAWRGGSRCSHDSIKGLLHGREHLVVNHR